MTNEGVKCLKKEEEKKPGDQPGNLRFLEDNRRNFTINDLVGPFRPKISKSPILSCSVKITGGFAFPLTHIQRSNANNT